MHRYHTLKLMARNMTSYHHFRLFAVGFAHGPFHHRVRHCIRLDRSVSKIQNIFYQRSHYSSSSSSSSNSDSGAHDIYGEHGDDAADANERVDELVNEMREHNKCRRYHETIRLFWTHFRVPQMSATEYDDNDNDNDGVTYDDNSGEDVVVSNGEHGGDDATLLPADQRALSCLFQSYARKGNIKMMTTVRKMMQRAGMPLGRWVYNMMIQTYLERRMDWRHSWRVFIKMKLGDDKTIRPDNVTYVLMIRVFSEWGKLAKCLELFEQWKSDMATEDADTDNIDRKTGAVKVYGTMLAAFVRNDRLDAAQRLFEMMQDADSDVAPDEVIYNIMADGYAKQGMIAELKQLLQNLQDMEMPLQHVRRNLLESFVKEKDLGSAEHLMGEAEQWLDIEEPEDLKQVAFMYSTLIRGLLDVDRFDDAMNLLERLSKLHKLNASMVSDAVEASMGFFMSYVDINARHNKRDPIVEVDAWLAEVGDKQWIEIESISVLINDQRVIALANMGRTQKAIALLRETHQKSSEHGIQILSGATGKAYEAIIFNIVKRAPPHTASEAFRQIRSLLREMLITVGPSLLRKTCNLVLHQFVERKMYKLAISFARLMQQSEIMYESQAISRVLEAHASRYGMDSAIKLFNVFYYDLNAGEKMDLMKLAPDNAVLSVMVKGFMKNGMYDDGVSFYQRIAERYKLEPSDYAVSSLVDGLMRAGKTGYADQIVSSVLQNRSVLEQINASPRKRKSWAVVINTLLAGYTRIGTVDSMDNAMKIFHQYFILDSSDRETSDQLGERVSLFEADEYTVSTIVSGLVRTGLLEKAERFFMLWLPDGESREGPKVQLAAAFQALLSGLCDKNRGEDVFARAVQLFHSLCLEKRWIKFNEVTVSHIINGYFRRYRAVEALEVFEEHFLRPFYETDKHVTGIKKTNKPHKFFATVCLSLFGWCVVNDRYSDIVRIYPLLRHHNIFLTRGQHQDALLHAANEQGRHELAIEWFQDIQHPSPRCWVELDRAMTATGMRSADMVPDQDVFRVKRDMDNTDNDVDIAAPFAHGSADEKQN